MLSDALVAFASHVVGVNHFIGGEVPTEIPARTMLLPPTGAASIEKRGKKSDESISSFAFDAPVVRAKWAITAGLEELASPVKGPVFDMDD